MVGKSNLYYDNITGTLNGSLLWQYDAEICKAKATWLENPKAMDIMAANHINSKPSFPLNNSSVQQNTLFDWLQMALRLEERQ